MVTKEKLYEAFGELIYAVAKADGVVQGEEVAALEKILKNHSWAKDIVWSFNYEAQKNNSVEYVYDKAMDIFKEHGPSAEYEHLLDILQAVAEASRGDSATEATEKGIINLFQQDLIKRFRDDLQINYLSVTQK
jgi:uncharacterized tellurite resistance protein B-like protein